MRAQYPELFTPVERPFVYSVVIRFPDGLRFVVARYRTQADADQQAPISAGAFPDGHVTVEVNPTAY